MSARGVGYGVNPGDRGRRILYLSGLLYFVAYLAGCTQLEKVTAPVDLGTLQTLQQATAAVESQGKRLLVEHKDRLKLLADDGQEKPPAFDYIRIPELEINQKRVEREKSVQTELYALQVLNAYASALAATKASTDQSVYSGPVNKLASLLASTTGVPVLGDGLKVVLSGLQDVNNHIAVVESLRATIDLGGKVAHPVIHLIALLDDKALLLLSGRHTDYTAVIVATTIDGQYQTQSEAYEHRLKLNLEINGFLTAIREYRGLLDQTRKYMEQLIVASAETVLSSQNLLQSALFVTWRADRLGEIVDGLKEDSQILKGVFR